MDAGSCVSETGRTFRLGFGWRSSKQRSSPNIVRTPSVSVAGETEPDSNEPRMAHLETLEAKMANIEVSLCNSVPRRRKSTSGSASVRSTPITRTTPDPSPVKEMRTALQDREAVIQNLRMQLGLGKLPRPSGTPLDESEKPAAEQRLHRLKVEAENKRITIRNLKMALDKLDITDNIDIRIQQAELEYALGREELQLLSLVEEAQALQSRFDKSKTDSGSVFGMLQSGMNLALIAVTSTVGRWSVSPKITDTSGLWIEWALEGEGLYRGDRLLEVNGIMVGGKSVEELQTILGTSGKCQLVVLRRKSTPGQQQQLLQSQEDNMRLQHRISYLEEQVKELQENKDLPSTPAESASSPHVTSISITSPPVTPPDKDKPEVYQRGNFIMTIVGGKPVKKATPLPISSSSSASSASSTSSQRQIADPQSVVISPPPTTHRQSINDRSNDLKPVFRQQQTQPTTDTNGKSYHHGNLQVHHTQKQQHLGTPLPGHSHQMHNVSRSISASSISINSDVTHRREKERKDRERELRREIRDRFIYKSRSGSRLDNGTPMMGTGGSSSLSYSKSGEHLHLTSSAVADKRREMLIEMSRRNAAHTINELSRSVKSLDFDSDYGGSTIDSRSGHKSRHHHHTKDTDYTSEPLGPKHLRPMPPKKPLRLSLQRAQSLQTVELNLTDIESRKKGMKRTYRGDRPPPDVVQFIESGSREILNGSLGRMKYV